MALSSVKVPKDMEPVFEKAERYVKAFFEQEKQDPAAGTITIGKQRYILIRASSMSVDFLEFIRDKYLGVNKEDAFAAASKLLFDLAHSIGKADARDFHKEMGVGEPMARLSAGPIHFAYSGWAFVDISPESRPVADKNYCLIYSHPHSFEADSWIESGKKTDKPVCIMNAGYSSGWCEESFGLELVSKEILCRAKGDKYCMFVMAQLDTIDKDIELYSKEHPELFKHEA
jgi:two-component system cell cycle sensor histidine kinase/response regulator CckA